MKKMVVASLIATPVLMTPALMEGAEVDLGTEIPDDALRETIQNALNTNETVIEEDDLAELIVLEDGRAMGIEDLTGIELFPQLEEIELRSNNIENLDPLQHLSELKVLDLRANSVHDLHPLHNLNQLVELDLRQNQVRNIDPLSNLIQLKELNLRENMVSDLTPLRELVNLQELNLHTNEVSNLSPLSTLESLEVLTLRRNNITNIDSLAELSQLKDTNLRDNDISDITPLQNLENLTVRLNLRGNDRLHDFSPVAHYYEHIEDVDFIIEPLQPFDPERFDPVTGEERENMLLQSLLENNRHIEDFTIRDDKFKSMNNGMFSFFRGSSHLYAADAHSQVVNIPDEWTENEGIDTWITGDFHVENVGFYGNRNEEPVFDFNDFDEVVQAPFYYDLIRFGSSMLMLNDISPGLQLNDEEMTDMLEHFGHSYTTALERVTLGDIDVDNHSFTPEKLEGFVGDTAEELAGIEQIEELNTWTTVQNGNRSFDTTNVRLQEATEQEKRDIHDHWSKYTATQIAEHDLSENHFTIKDIARRTNAGLGSLGYDRYYVLIEGDNLSIDHDIILDVKAQTKAPFEQDAHIPHAERTATGAKQLLPNDSSQYWGMLETNEQSFLVRERSRFKEEFSQASFSNAADLKNMVEYSAQVAAYAHSRSTEGFATQAHDAITQWDNFEEQLTEASIDYYGQVMYDFSVFQTLHADGKLTQSVNVPSLPMPGETKPLPFIDVQEGHYAENEIRALNELEIMTGNSNHQFRPTGNTTRAHFIVMLTRTFGLEGTEASMEEALAFNDINENTWYLNELSAALEHNIVSGYSSDQTIRGQEPVSRVHSIMFLSRTLDELFSIQPADAPQAEYTDIHKVTEEALPHVNLLTSLGVYSGRDGHLVPSEHSSRAQSAVVFYRFLEVLQ